LKLYRGEYSLFIILLLFYFVLLQLVGKVDEYSIMAILKQKNL